MTSNLFEIETLIARAVTLYNICTGGWYSCGAVQEIIAVIEQSVYSYKM